MTTQDAAPRVGRVETIRPPGVGDGMLRETLLTIVIQGRSGKCHSQGSKYIYIYTYLNIYIYMSCLRWILKT